MTPYTPPQTIGEHVVNSNAIEGIRHIDPKRARAHTVNAGSNDLLFMGHVRAARFVADNPVEAWRNPRAVHEILLKKIELYAGVYRTDRVFVGEREMPMPQHVLDLMRIWGEFVERVHIKADTRSFKSRAADAMTAHHIFLCIHPFEDGNGRTARLLLNAVRLSLGLPWLQVKYSIRHEYYRWIEEYEDHAFRPLFADRYIDHEGAP